MPQFTDMFGATQNDMDAAVRWAQQNHFYVTEIAPNRLLIQVDARVSDIERAFHVTRS